METRTIKQSVTIKASPHDVYEALMDAKKHAKFTGGKATISREVGGKFSVFDAYARGVNVELGRTKKSCRAGGRKTGRKVFTRRRPSLLKRPKAARN